MEKIPTLFVRQFDEKGKAIFPITSEITNGCEWVLDGEGIATRKWDGTCCLIQDGEIYKRFDYKVGRTLPDGAIPCQEKADENTGHFPHWVKCDANNPADKWHIKAFEKQLDLPTGTYELCGVHFQKNVDGLCDDGDVLIPHGKESLEVERTFEGIRSYLEQNEIEGIVFHRGNGEMCKIKRSDFGFSWLNKR